MTKREYQCLSIGGELEGSNVLISSYARREIFGFELVRSARASPKNKRTRLPRSPRNANLQVRSTGNVNSRATGLSRALEATRTMNANSSAASSGTTPVREPSGDKLSQSGRFPVATSVHE